MSCKSIKRTTTLTLLYLLTQAQVSMANELSVQDDVQIHGFISQSAIRTSANRYGGKSDERFTFDHREAGVGAIWRANADITVAGQILARQSGQSDRGSLRVDHLTFDYRFLDDDMNRLGVQVGQVKHPYGLYNMTRDVAHTRPGVMLPQSIYHDRVRDLALSAPGVSFYGGHFSAGDATEWRINAFVSDEETERLEALMFGSPTDGDFSGRPSWMAQIMHDRNMDNARVRFGVSLYDINMQYKSKSPQYLNGKSRISGTMFSVEYAESNWSLVSELVLGKVLSRGYGPLAIGVNQDNLMDAGYVQLNYRPASDITLYTRLGALYLDRDDRDGRKFAALVGGYEYSRYARDWTIGIRKDYGNLSLWAEAVTVRGTAWVPDLEIAVQEQTKNWDMLLLQAAYRW